MVYPFVHFWSSWGETSVRYREFVVMKNSETCPIVKRLMKLILDCRSLPTSVPCCPRSAALLGATASPYQFARHNMQVYFVFLSWVLTQRSLTKTNWQCIPLTCYIRRICILFNVTHPKWAKKAGVGIKLSKEVIKRNRL